MRNNLKFFAGFILLLTGTAAGAQSSVNPKADTVKWEYGKVENNTTNETLTLSGYFVSYGDKQFLWVQNGTDRKYTLDVRTVNGEWTNLNDNGELVYEAVCNEINGTIRLVRDRGAIRIHLDFATPEKLTPNIILQINTYSKI